MYDEWEYSKYLMNELNQIIRSRKGCNQVTSTILR
jgi:hypothetical protein